MADTRISDETAASALAGTELIEGVQDDGNVKITPAQIKTYTSAGPTITGHATIEGATLTGKTGSGKLVLATSPTIETSLTIGAGAAITSSGPGGALASGAFAAAYVLPAATTEILGGVILDGTTISANTDGTISAIAGAATLAVGSSDISGGTNTRILYDNSGKLGEYTTTGSGTEVALSNSPTLVTPKIGGATLQQPSAGTFNLNLPAAAGSAGDVLTSGGGSSAPMTWTTPIALNALTDTFNDAGTVFKSIQLTVADTNHAAGSRFLSLVDNSTEVFGVDPDGQVYAASPVNNLFRLTYTTGGNTVLMSGNISGVTLFGPVNTTSLTLGTQQTTQGTLVLRNTAAGAYATTIQSSNSATAAVTYTLPPAVATGAGYVLTDAAGNGVLSWAAGGGGLTIGTTGITSGTTTRFLYDLAGVVQESVGYTWDSTNQTATIASIANQAAPTLTLTGGTAVTTSQPVLSLTQTWITVGTTYTALKLNVTDTSSAAASLLADFQLSTVPKFQVNKTGIAVAAGNAGTNPSITAIGGNTYGINLNTGTGVISFAINTTGPATVNASGFQVCSYGGLQFSSSSSVLNTSSSTTDVWVTRGGPATLQLGFTDAAAPVAQTLRVQSVVAGTANGTAGVDFTIIGSSATGTGVGGNLIKKTYFSAKSTATTQGTAVDRQIIVAKGKVLTSGAAYSLCDIVLPTLTMCGGVIEATIVCTDGTDVQSFTQTVAYSAVNKGAVYTSSITASTGDKSISDASTLTTAWAIATGTNKITIQVTPTTSLASPSTNAFLLYFTIRNNSEQATTIL